MLRPTVLVLALSCATACASYAQQTGSTAAEKPAQNGAPNGMMAPATKTTPPVANVPATETVITLKGACPAKAGEAPSKACVSSLTRAQFEALTNALQPPDRGPVPPEIRRKFATQYAKLLVLADAARELGLENDPRVEQIFKFAKNQILAESLNQHYTEKFAHPSEQQVQQYYDQNKKKYQEVTLQRIIIPKQQASAPDKKAPTPEEQKAFADKIRERWVAGEDPVKLEKEAMERSEFKTSAPDVNVGARRPGSLPEAHEGVFELKAGEFSQVYSDPAAFYIYKVVSERQVPLSEVKTQIEQTVARQDFNDKIESIQKSVTPVLNEAYFGPEPPPGIPQQMIRPGMPPRGPMPGGPGQAAPPPPPPPAGAASPNPSSK